MHLMLQPAARSILLILLPLPLDLEPWLRPSSVRPSGLRSQMGLSPPFSLLPHTPLPPSGIQPTKALFLLLAFLPFASSVLRLLTAQSLIACESPFPSSSSSFLFPSCRRRCPNLRKWVSSPPRVDSTFFLVRPVRNTVEEIHVGHHKDEVSSNKSYDHEFLFAPHVQLVL